MIAGPLTRAISKLLAKDWIVQKRPNRGGECNMIAWGDHHPAAFYFQRKTCP